MYTLKKMRRLFSAAICRKVTKLKARTMAKGKGVARPRSLAAGLCAVERVAAIAPALMNRTPAASSSG